jgi:hypothetical protein
VIVPTRDLTVAIKTKFDEKGAKAAEDALRREEAAAKRAEKALADHGSQAKQHERALQGMGAQAERTARELDAIGSSALKSRRLLEDAAKRLPKLDIEADLSQPERALAELTNKLRELSGKRIGVDIDAGELERQAAEIRRELMTLEATHPEVVVTANVERAVAALERVEREARRVDGRVAKLHVEVEVDDEPAVRAESALRQAFGALQSMAPRSTATAVAALALLPPAALAASAGVTAALGGALAGLGLAASAGSEEAQDAIAHLREFAQGEAARIGEPFERVWTAIVLVAERELERLSPVVRDALDDLAPDVIAFVDQAGASLEELEPAIESIQRAFSSVLRELGPAMPQIMQHLATAITAITSAVEENPEAIVQMIVNLAALVEWAGKFGAALADIAVFVMDNWAIFRAVAAGMGIILPELVEVTSASGTATGALAKLNVGAEGVARGMVGAAKATGEQAEATKAATAEWARAFSQFGGVIEALGAVDAAADKSNQAGERHAAAQERLAEVRRAAAQRISRAAQDVADAEEQGAERVAEAQRRVATARERAAEQAERSAERIRDSREKLAGTVEEVARREEAAEQRVTDAQDRQAEAAQDGARQIEAAQQRVADATADAAAQEVDAARRVQDSHARTAEAVQDLEAAYASARRRVEELADAQAEGATDEEGAQIALERARERLEELKARRAGGDTEVSDLDLREAENGLRRAEQSLDRVRDRNAQLAQEIDQANRVGIEGSAEVVAAKERIAEAQRAELEAEAALAKAREDGARQVAEADRALADARQEAARQEQEAARAVAEAEAELNRARIDGAEEVTRAKKDVADAEKEAAKATKDAARDVADAQAAERQARKEAAEGIAEAERALAESRQQAARDTVKANQEVRDSWGELATSAATTTEQLFAELEKQIEDQRRWKENLISLAGRIPDEMFDELVKAGPAGAKAVALAAEMTDKELQRFVALYGLRGKDAADRFAKNMDDAGPALREIARTQGRDVAERVRQGMDDGRVSVQDAARRLGLDIDEGLDIGRPRVIKITIGDLDELIRERNEMRNREMGGIERYAVGAVRRSTAPMIASRPTILYGEGRDDEAFIPYDPQYRQRAESLLSQVADDFGGVFMRPAGLLGTGGGGGGVVTQVTNVYRTYNISPQVPLGVHKGQVGAEIVEAIQYFEKGSGAGWRD